MTELNLKFEPVEIQTVWLAKSSDKLPSFFKKVKNQCALMVNDS